MCVMNFQDGSLTDEQSNHDKIYTAQEEILLGIHIVPRQSCILFMLRDNWPIAYRKVIVFRQNAEQNSNGTMAFHCYLNSK